MTYKISLQKHPNNETRITLYPVRNRRESLRDQAIAILGCHASELEERGHRSGERSGLPPILDIRSEFKTQCNAHAHKRTEFGKYAKTRIMRAAGAMDRKDPHCWHYLFLTATLPSDSAWAKWAIAEDAHKLINGFKAWLSKRVKSRLEFYVWEHQDRQALHFHYCIHVPDAAVREEIAVGFRMEWMRLLDGCESRTGVSMWGRHEHLSPTAKYCILQTNVQEVSRSVAAYMAGYCGLKKDKHSNDNQIPYYPKRWFGVSRHLSTLVQEQTEEEVIEYSNYRAAKIAFDEFNVYFDNDSVRSKIFPHNVGVGETGVHYHPQKMQALLWQSRKPMIFKQANYPNARSMINLALEICLTLEVSMSTSQQFRALCTKSSVESLTDALYQGSLQRGSLNAVQVAALDRLYTVLSSESSLPLTAARILPKLQNFAMVISANYPQLKWNQYGWLVLTHDLAYTVDSLRASCHSGTRATEHGTQDGPDSYLPHVGREPNPSSEQLTLM